jgi:hypothetical protein
MVRDVSRGLTSHADFKDFFGKENGAFEGDYFCHGEFFWYWLAQTE